MNIDKEDRITVDISNLAEENHRYAIHLSTFQHVISYHKGTYKIANTREYNPFEAVDFWRNISLSAEVLLKACLLKHHILCFKKRAHGEYGGKVTALSNPWLDQILKQLEINYVAQINTGTISTALTNAQHKLFEQIQLSPQKGEMISQMFYVIIRTRRNRNSHFFFPNQSHIDIAEVEMLFLPLLNLLEEVYGLSTYHEQIKVDK